MLNVENSATIFNGNNNMGNVIEVENSETTLTNLMGRADNAIEKTLEAIYYNIQWSKTGIYFSNRVNMKDNMRGTKGYNGK